MYVCKQGSCSTWSNYYSLLITMFEGHQFLLCLAVPKTACLQGNVVILSLPFSTIFVGLKLFYLVHLFLLLPCLQGSVVLPSLPFSSYAIFVGQRCSTQQMFVGQCCLFRLPFSTYTMFVGQRCSTKSIFFYLNHVSTQSTFFYLYHVCRAALFYLVYLSSLQQPWVYSLFSGRFHF